MSSDYEKIASLDPKSVWSIFAEMTKIPRPSKQEQKIREHVKQFANNHGLGVKQEAIGNLVLTAPATPGHEGAPVVVLQGHLDMVCEKNRDTAFDWDNDALRLKLDTDAKTGKRVVRAEGTTLGADNGIGVAMALAVATEKDVVHGPLEILLTIDEEAGMSGAKALTPDSFTGRKLLNLDSEEDYALYIGCAGGCDTNLTWRFDARPAESNSEICRVEVQGLRGGHSGCDIHENRANAVSLLTRTLCRADVSGIRVREIVGGSKRNAIPREAFAFVAGPAGLLSALKKAAENVRTDSAAESYEKEIAIEVQKAVMDKPGGFLSEADSRILLDALSALPNGALAMHPKVPGLVQTSNNISTVETVTDKGALEIKAGLLSRSSSDSSLEFLKHRIAAMGRLSGAEIATANQYPGWEPNPESPLLAECKKVYEQLFGEPPHIAAIHAGLETGIIGKLVGNVDMVSFGPTIQGAHSPEERVFVDSVAKSWKLLVAVLAKLA
ncbi:MAG TPA: beta-Ala-His dipeptidase [Phycisphaerae bacterium]|nr:beta-Ala-His dipeptidase [Phycisphaerae bacterium]